MNRPELVNEFMLDVVITKEISARDDAVFDYIQQLEFEVYKLKGRVTQLECDRYNRQQFANKPIIW